MKEKLLYFMTNIYVPLDNPLIVIIAAVIIVIIKIYTL